MESLLMLYLCCMSKLAVFACVENIVTLLTYIYFTDLKTLCTYLYLLILFLSVET